MLDPSLESPEVALRDDVKIFIFDHQAHKNPQIKNKNVPQKFLPEF